jgi:ubiquinone/menaquinone biosynthesis C-methylase UbiE
MPDRKVDYNPLAATYDARYAAQRYEGIAQAVRDVARGAASALEAGCGTGRWLDEMRPLAGRVVGLDRSVGMLRQAQARPGVLICGTACRMPFSAACFDLILCVNALHHFEQPRQFVEEARRVLRPGGRLAVVGFDPQRGADKWYVYQFFDGTYEVDVARYPAWDALRGWMVGAGFAGVTYRVAERITHTFHGREVQADPFLKKDSTSQLVLLSDDAYAAGLAKIEAAIAQAQAAGETAAFRVDIVMGLMVGQVT